MKKERESMVHIYDSIVTIIRDVLRMEGRDSIQDAEVVKVFEDELISPGKVPARFLRLLNEILDAKNDYDNNKLTKTEVEKVRKSSRELMKFLVEYKKYFCTECTGYISTDCRKHGNICRYASHKRYAVQVGLCPQFIDLSSGNTVIVIKLLDQFLIYIRFVEPVNTPSNCKISVYKF